MTKKIISLDGMPCAGKSTCIQQLKKKHPEYIFFDEMYVVTKTKDALTESVIAHYANEELQKKHLLNALASTSKIILDRSFISTLAFAYAKGVQGNNADYIFFENFIRNSQTKIIFPDLFIFFLIPAEESIRRRQSLIQEDTLSIWTDPKFLNAMYDYYALNIYKELLPNVKVLTIDTSNISIDELYKKLESTIQSLR